MIYNLILLSHVLAVSNHECFSTVSENAGTGIHAISTSEFNMNFTSEGKDQIQSKGQAQQLLVYIGKLYGSIDESMKLKDKVEETENGYRGEVLGGTRRTSHGGSSGGGGKKGKAGTGGSADVSRRPRQSSATSKPRSWVSTFNLWFSLCPPFEYSHVVTHHIIE
ncbi:unnamed protein product [Sphenostylis stenocarpa]|uniref:Uncharacterized protein n=1 Tax=Sphenostylis stenocarpa TaxID=92480 RepID=A0AA86VNP4_9FABA|nr:unnamed protein product [Sphenostylis stenocarpa]